jgi:hypothetical protein
MPKKYAVPISPSRQNTASRMSTVATRTSDEVPTLDQTTTGTARRTSSNPAEIMLARMKVTALELWVITPARMPSMLPRARLLTEASTSLRMRGPASCFRCVPIIFTPMKNIPSPANSEARIWLIWMVPGLMTISARGLDTSQGHDRHEQQGNPHVQSPSMTKT